MTYQPTYLPDGRKAYNPRRTERDIHDEWAMFEQRLRDQGITDQISLHIQARELWRQEEQAGERWAEWQHRVWFPHQRANQSRSTKLTNDEWAYLAELLDGANHPLAMSIHIKAKANHQ